MRVGFMFGTKAALVLLASAALAQVVTEVVQQPNPPVIFENSGQLILAGLVTLTASIQAWLTIRKDKIAAAREALQRQWFIEDRKEAKEEAERIAERIRMEVLQAQDKVAREAWMRADTLTASINENTEISREAFRAANNVNEKIAAVGAMRRSEGQLRRDEDKPPEEPQP